VIQIGDFLSTPLIEDTQKHLLYSLKGVQLEGGLIAEFGVFKGKSINWIAAAYPKEIIHGFDSFRGLPERWRVSATQVYADGHFELKGILPKVAKNVRLHPGWFNESLPPFLAANPQPFKFINVDSDIYSSAMTILTLCNDRILPGTVIYFDEICDWGGSPRRYPFWMEHEFQALVDWCTRHKREVQAYSRNVRYGGTVVVTA
jgi:hypothetical protein